MRSNCLIMLTALWALATVFAAPAWATQGHGGIEGVYVHQMAHLFFMFSMALLIYWLRKRHLTTSAGWRFIQYSALFFILWNLDTLVNHWLEEQSQLIQVQRVDMLQISITAVDGHQWLGMLYFITKLDHLLCVPALIFLFLGLRRLLKTPPEDYRLEETVS